MERESEKGLRVAYEDVLSSVFNDEDAAVIEKYVARLEWYKEEYAAMKRRIDSLIASLTSGQFFGSHLVERRGEGRVSVGTSSTNDLSLSGVEDLNNPRDLGRSEKTHVDAHVQSSFSGGPQESCKSLVGSGGEEMIRQVASEEKESSSE